MRHLLLLLSFLAVRHLALAQSPSCDELPISYDPLTITFAGGQASFGDSVITIQITNTSLVDMAYPQIKLVPLTPLPSGMTQNTHWDTFASSWNAGLTMPADCFFDVTEPIPLNYTVTFEVWAYNLTPLLTGDSCVFDAPFTINLQPSTTGLAELNANGRSTIHPIPARDRITVELPQVPSGGRLAIMNAMGSIVRSIPIANGVSVLVVEVEDLAPGMYLVHLVGDNGPDPGRRMVIAR